MSRTNAQLDRRPDRVLIIADDLTGALDAVGAFAGSEPAPFVGFTPESVQHAPLDAPCVAINTDTRHASAEIARRAVREVARWGLDHGRAVIFKKTDSTLRGNVAAELAGLRDAGDSPTVPLIFAPAFPEAGRTVRAGHLALDGVPIHLTPLAKDPRSPIRESSVSALLAASHPPNQIHLASSLAGQPLAHLGQLRPGCHVLDGETPAEMAAIAASLQTATDRPLLLAGCAGLGRYLPAIIGSRLGGAPGRTDLPPGPALILQSSVTPRSLSQIERFKSAGGLGIEIGPDWLWASPEKRAELERNLQLKVIAAIAEKRSVLLHTPARSSGPDELDKFTPWNRLPADFSIEAPPAIARLGLTILQLSGYRTLVLSGGETAHAAIEALGCSHGLAQGEVHIGVNRLAIDALGRAFDVVTKSGGMGPEDLYEHFLP